MQLLPNRVRLWIVLVTGLVIAADAAAQSKRLTLDDLFDPTAKIDFSGTPPSGLMWISDTHYLWPNTDPKSRETTWAKVEALSGKTERFYDPARMEAAIAKIPGVGRDEAARLARGQALELNSQRTAVLLTIADDLYYYELGSDRVLRLTVSSSKEGEASFSPDGTHVAFVRDNNLFVVDIGTQRERAVTSEGGAELLNGILDWVYQEEIYGRGTYRAYWWSPDSTRLAFLQLNERPVPEFTVVDHIPYRQTVEATDYPKAGDPNPTVRLGLARVAGGAPEWIETDKYAPIEFLIVNVGWTPDSKHVVYSVQNREQTWLDLNLADIASHQTTTLLRETSKAWVNENGTPTWLKDGSFLWVSERSGWRHFYHYKPDGTLIRQVTDGRWEARALHGIDEATGRVYFSGTERSPIGNDIYRIRLDGTGLARLSTAPGTHSATFSPTYQLYIDRWSDATTPTQVRLHRADGTEARVIDENTVAALGAYRLSPPEFLQVKTRDGFTMEAMLIKPPDFDPSRRYPVYQHVYGGPHSQQVRNAWGGTTYLYHQLLAQRGIIVWLCDNRTASGKGVESTWPVYKNFGELELRDIEDGVAWLRQQSYVDPSRIGINGWSYGGFMVSYALTHSTSFAMGIAGGTVADWRDYDTIYTERYMSMPQTNPDGYRKSSPRFAAKDLHGRLLLLHGTIDDNVHLQNTIQFAYELQKAGKPFELMVYPKSRHGVTDPSLVKHMRETMVDFITRTLLQPSAARAATP